MPKKYTRQFSDGFACHLCECMLSAGGRLNNTVEYEKLVEELKVFSMQYWPEK